MRPAVVELSHVDRAAFAKDVDALRAELVADLGPADLAHLRRMVWWSRLCAWAGYATAPLGLNPLSALLISLGTFSRWIVMHHVGHRGYDRVPGVPRRWTSGTFARGWRRWIDWPDWMLPEAWLHEHNVLHHGRTGEERDPDLVERNALMLRESRLPRGLKLALVALVSVSWKYLYYAPNTIRELARAQRRRAGRLDPMSDEDAAREIFDLRRAAGRWRLWRLLDPRSAEGRALWFGSWLPYALLRFGLLPLPFLVFGSRAWLAVLLNSLAAELITNVHGFVTIAPNHAGDDLPRFFGKSRDKGELYVRQVAGSVNYPGGTDLSDFFQGYLNYQIEHHLWPDLPMLKYRQAQVRLRALCERHGVPYRCDPLVRRVAKLTALMIGDVSMPVGRVVPAELPASGATPAAGGE